MFQAQAVENTLFPWERNLTPSTETSRTWSGELHLMVTGSRKWPNQNASAMNVPQAFQTEGPPGNQHRPLCFPWCVHTKDFASITATEVILHKRIKHQILNPGWVCLLPAHACVTRSVFHLQKKECRNFFNYLLVSPQPGEVYFYNPSVSVRIAAQINSSHCLEQSASPSVPTGLASAIYGITRLKEQQKSRALSVLALLIWWY